MTCVQYCKTGLLNIITVILYTAITAVNMFSLQESYSLLIEATALSLSLKQIDVLGVCWNSVIQKLFNYKKRESVKGVLHGLRHINTSHLIMLRKLKFYKHSFLYRQTVYCIMCSILHRYIIMATTGKLCLEQFSCLDV